MDSVSFRRLWRWLFRPLRLPQAAFPGKAEPPCVQDSTNYWRLPMVSTAATSHTAAASHTAATSHAAAAEAASSSKTDLSTRGGTRFESTLSKAADGAGAITHAETPPAKATSGSAVLSSAGSGESTALTAIKFGIGSAVAAASSRIAIGEAIALIVIAPRRRPILARPEIAPFTGKTMEETRASRDISIVVEDYFPPPPVKAPGRPTPSVSPEKPEANCCNTAAVCCAGCVA